jgi:hypothetical protein
LNEPKVIRPALSAGVGVGGGRPAAGRKALNTGPSVQMRSVNISGALAGVAEAACRT